MSYASSRSEGRSISPDPRKEFQKVLFVTQPSDFPVQEQMELRHPISQTHLATIIEGFPKHIP
jgi:hypothetical protein